MIYTVGEMAQKLGVPASTLRYYDKEGLLPFVERSSGGIRMFRENDFEWLQVIRCMKKAGMSIKDIRQYIELSMQGDDTIDTRLEMFRHQREVLEAQMRDLQHTMDMVDYKCWYYETAQAAGTIDAPKNMPDTEVPEALRAIRQELKENDSASLVKVGTWECAYSKEMFQEEGTYYTSHLWITGVDDIAFECSFTVPKGGSTKEAEEVIATLEARKEGEKYPAELIPVRLSEIYQINEGYEWVVSTVKQELKKDFQGVEEDLEKIQQVIDSGKISPKKKDEWLAIGITVCSGKP